jgi:hypothetical protein
MVYIVGFDKNEQSRRAWYAAETTLSGSKREALTVKLALKATAGEIFWIFHEADTCDLCLFRDITVWMAKDF